MIVKTFDMTFGRDNVPSKSKVETTLRRALGNKRYNRDVLALETEVIDTIIKDAYVSVMTVTIGFWEFSPPSEYSGWELAAYVTEDSENEKNEHCVHVIASPKFEGDVRLLKYLDIKLGCDHCKTIRNRKSAFVFFKGTEEKVIAKGCAKEYFELNSADCISRTIRNLEVNGLDLLFDTLDLDEVNGCGSSKRGSRKYIDRTYVEPAIVYIIKSQGYVSQTSSDYTGSPSTVGILNCMMKDGTEVPEGYEIDHSELVKYWEGIRFDSSFNNDCYISVISFTPKLGVLCYAINAYFESLIPVEVCSSTHQGVIKEKIERDVTVTYRRNIQSYYGYTTLIKFKDESGNLFSTFYSGNRTLGDVKIGETLRLKGTVKEHSLDAYEANAPITILTRCK